MSKVALHEEARGWPHDDAPTLPAARRSGSSEAGRAPKQPASASRPAEGLWPLLSAIQVLHLRNLAACVELEQRLLEVFGACVDESLRSCCDQLSRATDEAIALLGERDPERWQVRRDEALARGAKRLVADLARLHDLLSGPQRDALELLQRRVQDGLAELGQAVGRTGPLEA